ncbi:acetoacetate decarboxylase family protein [Salinigranum halophilum]|uniref:acetoacetate decarboxylase family protein n=1 Tax=Salinigranum halophilum TaxID=2565931 RepID=UPI0010A85E91|nr:acetoacetate decarboxylase family protein [Salinigranum halophilum]
MATGSAPRQLSTGHEVTVPLTCRARLGGAVFAADWAPLRAALPADLTPLRFGARRGAVTVVGIDYRAVGSLEPYREFAVVVPVAAAGVAGVPTSLDGIGGYVVDLPVTTAPARALGDELWGFPKSVADITLDGTPDSFSVSLFDAGNRDVELSVAPGPTRARRVRQRLTAFSHLDDRLVRTPVDLDAEARVATTGDGVSLARGHGRYAAVLRDLGVRPRVYAQFVASHAEATLHPPERVD